MIVKKSKKKVEKTTVPVVAKKRGRPAAKKVKINVADEARKILEEFGADTSSHFRYILSALIKAAVAPEVIKSVNGYIEQHEECCYWEALDQVSALQKKES